jgi:hypothetical protein
VKFVVVFIFRQCKVRKEFSPLDGFIFYRPANRPTLSEFVQQTVQLSALSPHKGTQKLLDQVLSSQLEKPREFDPRGQATLTPASKNTLTPYGKIKMTPENNCCFRGFFIKINWNLGSCALSSNDL